MYSVFVRLISDDGTNISDDMLAESTMLSMFLVLEGYTNQNRQYHRLGLHSCDIVSGRHASESVLQELFCRPFSMSVKDMVGWH